MADEKQPHLRPFKPKPLPEPEHGSMASEEDRRLHQEGLPSMRSLLMEPEPIPKGFLHWADILNAENAPYDWLIPGILEREDRIILTGDEGYGKSTLLRQLALSACIGENTLTSEPLNTHSPITVLYVDLENPRRHILREIRKLMALLDAHNDSLEKRFGLHIDSAGMVLDDPKDKDEDRAQLLSLLHYHKPDLLIIGPLYKMLGGDPTDERDCRELARFMDLIRGRYHCAVIMEAHAPHNQKRPFGWSGWKRWPERGIHLDNEGSITNWRGTRGDTVWPTGLARAVSGWQWRPRAEIPPAHTDRHEEKLATIELEIQRILRRARTWLTRFELWEQSGRNKNEAYAAMARLKQRGTLIEREFAKVNARGEIRQTPHLAINPDREPDAAGITDPGPIGAQIRDTARIIPLFADSDEDEPYE